MITHLHFSIQINADKKIIWNALWSDQGYRDWTSLFSEGSYANTEEWIEGSTVHLLGPDEGGIYSKIEQHTPYETMHFKHIGLVVKGIEQPLDDATKLWTGCSEKYTLQEGSDQCTLNVEIDVMNEHLAFMKATFPNALNRIKERCEKT